MSFLRDVNRRIDLPLLAATALLSVGGLLAVYSATEGGPEFWRQVLWVGLGWAGLAAALVIPYRWVVKYAGVFFGLVILTLAILAFRTVTAGGVHRWFTLGPFTFQPSEFAKLATALLLALLLDYFHRLDSIPQFIFPITAALLPAVLVAMEPDLGTAAVFLPILLAALFWGGGRVVYMFLIISPLLAFISSFKIWLFLPFIALVVLSAYFGVQRWWERLAFVGANVVGVLAKPLLWGLLKEYQKARILSFLSPAADPHGEGYSVIQAKIALGSGRLWGKGFLNGTQVHLKFLPEGHTDFVFPTWGEEWGYVGCVVVIALFATLFARAVLIAYRAADRRGAVLAFTLGALLLFQFGVNATMAAGLIPVTGIPLPFLSYGGSITITSFIAVGLILNVKFRRDRVWRELKIRGG